MSAKRAVAQAPGSCGELAQGLIDGNHFLVSCPIDMYATATVEISAGTGRIRAPSYAQKACRAVQLTLDHFGWSDVDVNLALSSSLPRGKGMASSTADVSASIAATAACLGESGAMPPAEIARIALLIEPSDGLMLQGISMIDHRYGTCGRSIGPAPSMRVVVLDFGGIVDTLEFNELDSEDALRRLQPRFEEALDLIVQGIEGRSPEYVAAGATISAVANQQLLFKPQLEAVMSLAEEVGALGVNVAHSGTVIGMLFEDDPSLARWAASQACERLPEIRMAFDRRVVNGGIRLLEEVVWSP